MVLLAACGVAPAADPVPPASGYPQVAATEPVFVSSKKPLPAPPAALAKPISVPIAPVKPANVPAAIKQPTAPPMVNVVMPAQIVEPPPAVAEAPSVTDALKEYQILLESPSPEMLFGKLDSEKMLEKRMRQQAMQRQPPDTVQFPYNPPLTKAKYQERHFAEQTVYEEPNFVCYNRLYFEEKNAERYGWDLGFMQPVVSQLYFYKDLTLLPLRFIARPCQRFDSSAGECLPGDPVPYIVYPPEINLISCWR